MSVVIGYALILVLLALAGLHLYWGLGGFWPGHDAPSLVATVVGSHARRAPGFVECAAVAFALAAAASIVFMRQGRIQYGLPALIVYGGYTVLILVFAGRGLATYLTPFFDYARDTPFFDLNRQLYSPLCLAIAAGLMVTYPPGVTRAFAA